jgi:uracil-DNA glycosylase family 4
VEADEARAAAREQVQGSGARAEALADHAEELVACRRCPRLVAWREEAARERRAAFDDQRYWGRPVPGFGDPDAWLLVLGLAPAAHGANRTGRMFTGDRSGDWLYRALHRAGLADRPRAEGRGDGLRLRGTWITAPVRCAPPENRPTPDERGRCRPWLEREIDLLGRLRVVVALGGYGYRHAMRVFRDRGWDVPSPMPDFGHGLELRLAPPDAASGPGHARGDGAGGGADGRDRHAAAGDGGGAPSGADAPGGPPRTSLDLVCSYHPSQQNTFTGTLTEEMFDAVWDRAVELGPGEGDVGV